jgi:cysteine synthase A
MPSDQSREKVQLMRAMGGEVQLMPPSSIVDPLHVCKAAQLGAAKTEGGVYSDQFDNPLNFQVHYETTGHEILEQVGGGVQMFVASAGTGGLIGGVSRRLKERCGSIVCVLVDPPGSALARRVTTGVLFNPLDREGHRPRHLIRPDSVVEGVGLNRLTLNFQQALPYIDHAFTATDREVVAMAHWLLHREGLFLGGSSALNLCGVVKACRAGLVPRGSTIVTVLCDGGQRYMSRLWDHAYLKAQGLLPDFVDPETGAVRDPGDDFEWIT